MGLFLHLITGGIISYILGCTVKIDAQMAHYHSGKYYNATVLSDLSLEDLGQWVSIISPWVWGGMDVCCSTPLFLGINLGIRVKGKHAVLFKVVSNSDR